MEKMKRLSRLREEMLGGLPKHLLFLALVAFRVFGLLQHEMWRTEAQLPLMVRDSQSFGQLLHWQSYGREHILWPSMLYGMKMLGLDAVVAGQWLHLGLSIILLGVIFYGIPRLPLIIRASVGSSFFLMYEYSAITRVYGVTALLLAIFVMLELRIRRGILWKALTLFFMSLSSNVGLVLAIALAVYLFAKRSEEQWHTRAMGAGIVALGIGLSIATALPPADLSEAPWLVAYRADASRYWGIPHLLPTTARMFLDGFLYIPIMTSPHWYEPTSWSEPQSLLSGVISEYKVATYLIGLAVIALAVRFLWHLFRISKPIALGVATLWGGNLLAWSVMHPGYTRHFGILLLGTLGLFALAADMRKGFSVKGMTIIVVVILAIQSASGFWAVYAEVGDSFSQSKNLAQWWQANYPEETPYVFPDHVGATLSLYTGGYAYSLASEREEAVSFVRESEEFAQTFSPALISNLDLRGDSPFLITNFPYHALLDGGKTIVEPVRAFQSAVAFNESFWVHRVRHGSESELWTFKFLPFEGQFWTVETSQHNWQQNVIEQPEPRFDNETGSAIEIKIKFLEAPNTDPNALVFQLLDGRRPLKVSFFGDGFRIQYDVLRTRYEIDTTDDFHVYRFTLRRNTVEAYVDGKKVGSSYLSAETEDKRVLLGNVGTRGENIAAQIKYVAYSASGALPPEGEQEPEEAEIWTMFTDMQMSPDAPPAAWAGNGTFSVKSVVDGVLTVATRGTDLGHFSQLVPEFDNAVGSTAEVRLKLLDGPKTDSDGAMLSISDGLREAKIAFFTDHINILDQSEFKRFSWMDTTDDFHTYRIAIIGDSLRVYVDGAEVAAATLRQQATGRQVLFGDFSTSAGENMGVRVDYLAYSVNGAKAPDGSSIKTVEGGEEEQDIPWTSAKGGFVIRTVGKENEPAGTGYPIKEFDNSLGSTLEVKMRILEAPASGFNGGALSLIDGQREGKLSFFNDRVEIRDVNDFRQAYELDTTDGFHVYRLTIVEDTLKAYVDGMEVAMVTLANSNKEKKILFGDFSPEEGENIYAQVEYLAYYVGGAVSPRP
ncbi:MAG: hypothetical protein KJ624_01320 [Chloroflexi bacterium]|nr:hypothetical protein [Chloroflexota bacterium]